MTGKELSGATASRSLAEPKYVAETLAWCNALRKDRGKRPLKKLPKGKRYSPESCPCGAATGLYVERFGVYESEAAWASGPLSNKLSAIPKPVAEFIKAFDSRLLPQYEARENTSRRRLA